MGDRALESSLITISVNSVHLSPHKLGEFSTSGKHSNQVSLLLSERLLYNKRRLLLNQKQSNKDIFTTR